MPIAGNKETRTPSSCMSACVSASVVRLHVYKNLRFHLWTCRIFSFFFFCNPCVCVCTRACVACVHFVTSATARDALASLWQRLWEQALTKPGWLLCNVSHAHFKQPANNVVFMSVPRLQMQMRCQTNRGILRRARNSNNIFSRNPKWGQWPALWNKFKNIQCVALWQLGDHPLYSPWGD